MLAASLSSSQDWAHLPPAEWLSEELLLHTFSFLPGALDLIHCCLVNRRWHRLAHDDSLWKNLAVRRGYKLPFEETEERALQPDEGPPQGDLNPKPTHPQATSVKKKGKGLFWSSKRKKGPKDIPPEEEEELNEPFFHILKEMERDQIIPWGGWKKWFVQQLLFKVHQGIAEESECFSKRDENKEEEEEGVLLKHVSKSEQIVFTSPLAPDRKLLPSSIAGGTKRGLLNFILCHAPEDDTSMIEAFLLTHQSFMQSTLLVKMLQEVFVKPPHYNVSEDYERLWKQYKLSTLQKRICLLLELWLLRHPEHFVEDQHLKEELMAFIEEGILAFPNKEQELNKIRNMVGVVTQHCSPTSKNCHDEEETEQQEAEESPEHEDSTIDEQDYSKYIVLDILKLDSKKVAQQLTIIDFDIYKNIRASELLDRKWKRKSNETPNVNKLIQQFNKMSCYISMSVVSTADKKKRIKVLEKWISVAQQCFKLQNLNSTLAVISGLSSAAVSRLKQTWEKISKSSAQAFDSLSNLFSRVYSYKQLRQHMKQNSGPFIPYLGMYLVDLCFIADGNLRVLDVPDDSHEVWLNWNYYFLSAQVVSQLLVHQKCSYSLERDNALLHALSHLPKIDLSLCFTLSLSREPRRVAATTTTASASSSSSSS